MEKMNVNAFTGRAQAYTMARPNYPDDAIRFIQNITGPESTLADIGAGTGKLTALLAPYGNKIFAVEPNRDMLEQLAITIKSFSNVQIVDGSAEATTLPDKSVDVIINAQALNRFDLNAFKTECFRISANPVVISLFNFEKDKTFSNSRYDKSTGTFYSNPTVQTFANPIFFTRDNWLLYHESMEGVPRKNSPGYESYLSELNTIFDRDSVNGILCHNLITYVYSEKF